MTTTRPKIAGKLPDDAGLRSLAEHFYDKGLGTSAWGVVRLVVDRRAQLADGTVEVRFVIDDIEVDIDSNDAELLLQKIYEARTSGGTLPFPGEDGHEKWRHDKLLAALGEWRDDGDLTDEDITERWIGYFGEDSEPANLGRRAVDVVVLQEFCMAIGAIDDKRADEIRDEANAQVAAAAGPVTVGRLTVGDAVFDGAGVPCHVVELDPDTNTALLTYGVPGHLASDQRWAIGQVGRRKEGVTEQQDEQQDTVAETEGTGTDTPDLAAPDGATTVPAAEFSEPADEVTAKRKSRKPAAS